MKSMFIVYHDLKTEARSQEILEVSKLIGETTLVSFSKPNNSSGFKFIETGKGKRNYFKFLWGSLRAIWNERPDVLILHDNYTSVLLMISRIISKKIFIVYDSSELYIDRKNTSWKLKLASHMNYFEKKFIKNANIVIAANIERANIMYDYFKLRKKPIIFDNIHMISENYDQFICETKYSNYLVDDVFNIVYGGGIAKHRFTYELAEAVGRLGSKYQLIVVGSATNIEVQRFEKFLSEKKFTNVAYLGFLPRDEWRFLLSNSKLSISAFTQDNLNNKYCASGKLYESLFEGTPILTSENPPLKRICEEYKVGISTSDFYNGILEIGGNYEYYCENVKSFIKTLDYGSRIEQLAMKIKNDIKLKGR